MEKMKKISLVLIPILILTAIVALPSVSASTRFDAYTKLYTVETQAEVDALPSTIDATGDGIAILVKGSGLMIEGFTISGASEHCIAVDEQSDVTVRDCTLTGSLVGIYYYGSSGMISQNTVTEYGKNGITANLPSGDGGSVNIFGNTVTGRGQIGLGDYAQNGIQIGYGAIGVVRDNQVSDNWYTAADWAACGILIFEADDCMIQRNELTDNQAGVCIEAWGWYLPSASENRVVKNTIEDGQVGVSVHTFAWSYSGSDPMADNNKVVNNVIKDQDDVGVSIGAFDTSDTYDPSADNNKVIHNKFTNVDPEIDDGGTETKVHANVWS
ncbi:nitrous oxide reductase family maturation protein NosD [Thermoproteota archaeon]